MISYRKVAYMNKRNIVPAFQKVASLELYHLAEQTKQMRNMHAEYRVDIW